MYKELSVTISAMFGKMKPNKVHAELQYLMDEFYELNPVLGSYNGDHITYIAEDGETIDRIMSIVNQIGEPFSLFFTENSHEDNDGNLHRAIFIDQSIFRVNGFIGDFHDILHDFFKSTTGVWMHSLAV